MRVNFQNPTTTLICYLKVVGKVYSRNEDEALDAPTTSQVTPDPDGRTPVSKNVTMNQNRLPQTGEIKGSGLSMIGLILLSTTGLIGWVKYNDSKQSK